MAEIRRVLIDDWDPIGIKGSGPADEYDSYIGDLYGLLKKGPSEDEIVEHLVSIDMAQKYSTAEGRARLKKVAGKLLKVDFLLD